MSSAAGDLHVVDVVAVPERLEDRVAEAQRDQVLDRLLAEVVVDAEDLPLGEHAVEVGVEGIGAREVVPERLLDDEAREAALVLRDHAGGREVVVDRPEHARRDRAVVDAVAARAVGAIELFELLAEAHEVRGVLELARHVVQAAREVGPHHVVDRLAARELADGLAHARAKLLFADVGQREADDRHARRQEARDGEVVERRDQLAARQVARGAEDDEDARRGGTLGLETGSKGVGGHPWAPEERRSEVASIRPLTRRWVRAT